MEPTENSAEHVNTNDELGRKVAQDMNIEILLLIGWPLSGAMINEMLQCIRNVMLSY